MTRLATLFFANTFMLLNRLFGVNRSILIVGSVSKLLSGRNIDLKTVSENLDYCYTNYRFLIFARKQKCLWRGYALYFYAKGAKLPVKLVFGARKHKNKNNNELDWHCWIEENATVRFELPQVIAQYEPFIEYS